MKLLAIAALGLVAACSVSPVADPPSSSEHRIQGRVLLPEGEGRRGAEVRVITAGPGGGEAFTWIKADEQGRFEHVSAERPLRVALFAAGVEVVAQPFGTGEMELDGRVALVAHSLRLAPAEGAPAGEVRLAPWVGVPPVGPMGGQVSLGSAQFPEHTLPTTTAWLLPKDAPSVSFLVERPEGAGRGRAWQTGAQTLFGPYSADALPSELRID